MDARQLQSALDILGSEGKNIAVYHRSPLKCTAKGIALRAMPQQALATARELFGTLRDFDETGAQLIWIETPPRHCRLGRRARPPATCSGCGLRGLLADF